MLMFQSSVRSQKQLTVNTAYRQNNTLFCLSDGKQMKQTSPVNTIYDTVMQNLKPSTIVIFFNTNLQLIMVSLTDQSSL